MLLLSRTSCSLVLPLLLLCLANVDSRHISREHRLRQFWQNIKDIIKENTINRFQIDLRHFDKEEMLLFPDVAFQSADADGSWTVVVHGWRYQGSRRKDWLGFSATHWIERIAYELLNPSEAVYLNGTIDRDRLRPFFVDDESNELITVNIGEKTFQVRTNNSGQFYEQFKMSDADIQALKQKQQRSDFVTYGTIGDNGDTGTGPIRLMEPRQGISIISDIDDTIKISEVLDKVRLLANTFIHPFKPVPGMADLYQQWDAKHSHCTFHYLSGMPDQLYTLTQEFINTNKFPDGSFHMRHFGWGPSSLFKFLHSEGTFNHKLRYLRFFLGSTIRDYVLVGDSGEKDPEVYGTIAREYPQRVRAIFIRAIKGETFNDQRFITAFDGVPRAKWQVFDNPQQLPLDLTTSPNVQGG